MKYQITINQEVLSQTYLDITDAAILDYLIFYCNSQSPKIESQRIIINGNKYTWVDYKSLINDMPLLRIKSKGAITPRIKKIESTGYISTILENGSKLFIKLNNSVDELFIKLNAINREPFTKMNATVHETKPIKNTNIKNTIDKESASQKYLLNIPLEDIKEFILITSATEPEIRRKGEALLDYCKAHGKKYKDYKAFMRNALRRDYPKKSILDEKWEMGATGA